MHHKLLYEGACLQELAAYVAEGADDDTEPAGFPVSEASDSEAGRGALAAPTQVWRLQVPATRIQDWPRMRASGRLLPLLS